MVVDNFFRVIQATVADLDGAAVEDFFDLVSLGKCLSTRGRNLRLILALTFLLNGGYQRMLFCCRFLCLAVVGLKCTV